MRISSSCSPPDFPGADAAALYAASAAASKIIPQATRFFWGDIDFRWFPEACVHKVGGTRFYTVADFMRGVTMPGTGILNIRQWRARVLAGLPPGAPSPPEAADALERAADTTLRLVAVLRAGSAVERDRELRLTVGDFEAMAYLGRYYAEKIRGACALALFDAGRGPPEQARAIAHLERALKAWRQYAAVRDAQYLPNFYGRIGWIDVTALTAEAAKDIDLARAWTPGTLEGDAPAPAEERRRLSGDAPVCDWRPWPPFRTGLNCTFAIGESSLRIRCLTAAVGRLRAVR